MATPRSRSRRSLALAHALGFLSASCLLGERAEADSTIVPIALFDEQAPGVAAGVTFELIERGPLINDAGDVVFSAWDSASIDWMPSKGIWVFRPESGLALLVHNGEQAAGMEPGVTYNNFYGLLMNSAGEIAFWGSVLGPDITQANGNGLWKADAVGNVSLVVRAGEPVPGAPGMDYFLIHEDSYNLDASGRLSFNTALYQAGSFFAMGLSGPDASGDPILRVAAGDPAPELPPGVVLDTFEYPYIHTASDAGDLAFPILLAGPGIDHNNNRAIFRSDVAGALSLVARQGDPAPDVGEGIVYSSFSVPQLNSSGQLVFLAGLQGAVITGANYSGAFVSDGVDVRLLARSGDPARGGPPGSTYQFELDDELRLAFNDSGEIALEATLQGPGVTEETSYAVFGPDGSGNPRMLLRAGNRPPGMPRDLRLVEAPDFWSFGPLLNDEGAVLIEMGYVPRDSPTPSPLTIPKMLCYVERGAPPIALLRHGTRFSYGTVATYKAPYPAPARGDTSALNNAGEAAVFVTFTGGPRGVFVVAAPEPGGWTLAFAATSVLLALAPGAATRRRRASSGPRPSGRAAHSTLIRDYST